jgi:hypothetical protein
MEGSPGVEHERNEEIYNCSFNTLMVSDLYHTQKAFIVCPNVILDRIIIVVVGKTSLRGEHHEITKIH